MVFKNEGVATSYKISGIMSRAPTESLVLFQKADSDNSRDPFKYLPDVVHEKVTCDGREILILKSTGLIFPGIIKTFVKALFKDAETPPCPKLRSEVIVETTPATEPDYCLIRRVIVLS